MGFVPREALWLEKLNGRETSHVSACISSLGISFHSYPGNRVVHVDFDTGIEITFYVHHRFDDGKRISLPIGKASRDEDLKYVWLPRTPYLSDFLMPWWTTGLELWGRKSEPYYGRFRHRLEANGIDDEEEDVQQLAKNRDIVKKLVELKTIEKLESIKKEMNIGSTAGAYQEAMGRFKLIQVYGALGGTAVPELDPVFGWLKNPANLLTPKTLLKYIESGATVNALREKLKEQVKAAKREVEKFGDMEFDQIISTPVDNEVELLKLYRQVVQ